jgi:hypothetical protein
MLEFFQGNPNSKSFDFVSLDCTEIEKTDEYATTT